MWSREVIAGKHVKFQVLSARDVESINPGLSYVVISITDPDAPEAVLPDSAHCLGVLRLRFHDVQSPRAGRVVISSEDAQAIVDFIRTHRDEAQLIICQCRAGICRSSAVAAALSRWLQDEDELFFRYYIPNEYVYQVVLEALRRSDETDEKPLSQGDYSHTAPEHPL